MKVGGTSQEKDYNLLLTHPRYIPEEVGGYAIAAYGPSNTRKSDDQLYSFDVLQNNGDFSKTMNSNLNISTSLNYDFGWSNLLKGLKLKFAYSKSITTSKTNEYGSSFNVYSMDKRYGSGSHMYAATGDDATGVDFLGSSNFNRIETNNGDYLSRSMIRTDNYQMNLTLQYQRAFGDHDISALFSIEKSEAESEYLVGQRMQPYPFTTYQSNSATGEESTTFTRSESGTLSYIGRINYAYANRYLVEFLLRADASTKFAPETYWGTFPAASLGWVASEEPWFRNVKWLNWIDFLKVRTSFGLTGRDNTAAWQWMKVYNMDQNRGVVFGDNTPTGGRITFNKETSAVNADVHWDKSYKWNFGIDLRFLDQRLSVTFDHYREWNREMLMKISQNVPSTVGTQSAAQNVGEINNWGYELSVKWRDKIGKDFKYSVGVNAGYSDNEVLKMNWADEYIYRQIQYGGRTDLGLWGMQCLGMFRSFQEIEEYFETYMKKADGTYGTYMGLSKDDVRPGMLIYKDVRGEYDPNTGTYAGPDGVVDEKNDQVQLGKRGNIYGFTMNLGAEWKGISLTAQFNAQWGGYTTVPGSALKFNGDAEFCNMPSFWNPDDMFSYQDVWDENHQHILVPANVNGSLPNLAYSSVNSVASSFWRVSAARVTLNRLTIAYTIPKSLLKYVGFVQSARVNVTGQNLISFYNPYPDRFINPMSGTYGSYPNLRKWTIGVNLSF